MKRITISLLIIIIVQISLFAQQSEINKRTLEETISSFYNTIEKGDVSKRIELLDKDVILMPNGFSLIKGKEEVSKLYTADTATVEFKIKDRKIVDMIVSDSIAITVNSYYYTWNTKGENPNWRKTKNVHIWKKDTDGKWKLRLDIWNSDLPIEFKN
mgnify:FL=1